MSESGVFVHPSASVLRRSAGERRLDRAAAWSAPGHDRQTCPANVYVEPDRME
jgi:hypothetical protein